VLAQIVFYAFVYFSTFYQPAEHIRSSFHRLAAALLPLALMVMAGVSGALRETRRS
jgi:hypothetical protein